MQGSFGYMNLNLNRYGIWIALVVFVVVILTTFREFTMEVPPNPNTEYKWSVDISRGVNIYPYEEHGFIEGLSLAYTPIYFLAVGNLMKVFGTSPLVGKIVSTLAALGIALLIYLISSKLTSRKLLSIIPGVLFLLYPAISNYSSAQVKTDILGLFFAVLSIYLVFNKHYLWAVPVAVLAFFTKQYYVAVPIATAMFLLWRERQVLFKYVGLYMGLLGIGFGIGQYITGGTFLTHTVVYLFSAPDFTTFKVGRYIAGILMCLGYLAPVLLIALYGMWKVKEFGLLGAYLVVSLLVMVITIGKVGSGINYTFESLVAGCCLSSLVLVRGRADRKWR